MSEDDKSTVPQTGRKIMAFQVDNQRQEGYVAFWILWYLLCVSALGVLLYMFHPQFHIIVHLI